MNHQFSEGNIYFIWAIVSCTQYTLTTPYAHFIATPQILNEQGKGFQQKRNSYLQSYVLSAMDHFHIFTTERFKSKAAKSPKWPSKSHTLHQMYTSVVQIQGPCSSLCINVRKLKMKYIAETSIRQEYEFSNNRPCSFMA